MRAGLGLPPGTDELGNYTERSAPSSSHVCRSPARYGRPRQHPRPRCVRSVHPDDARMDRADRFPSGRFGALSALLAASRPERVGRTAGSRSKQEQAGTIMDKPRPQACGFHSLPRSSLAGSYAVTARLLQRRRGCLRVLAARPLALPLRSLQSRSSAGPRSPRPMPSMPTRRAQGARRSIRSHAGRSRTHGTAPRIFRPRLAQCGSLARAETLAASRPTRTRGQSRPPC